jgi:DnaJ-class molecular chaperone
LKENRGLIMIDYHKELIKKYHPDKNNGCKACSAITKVINNLKRQDKRQELKNLYERLIGYGYKRTK